METIQLQEMGQNVGVPVIEIWPPTPERSSLSNTAETGFVSIDLVVDDVGEGQRISTNLAVDRQISSTTTRNLSSQQSLALTSVPCLLLAFRSIPGCVRFTGLPRDSESRIRGNPVKPAACQIHPHWNEQPDCVV